MPAANIPNAQTWYQRGLAAKREGDLTQALAAFKQSIKLDGSVAAPWIGLAQILDSNSQLEDALQCLLRATAADPKHALAHRLLGIAQQNLGYIIHARQAFLRALELAPTDAITHFHYGRLQEDLGSPVEAAAAYRAARHLQADAFEALASLLGLSMHVDVSAEIDEARRLVHQLRPKERATVGYGLGKAFQQQSDYDAAFAAFAAANTARAQTSGRFNREAFDASINEMINVFSPAFFRQRQTWTACSDSERAVFVVGLPRSGTTLTEQMLASHPACFGAGELHVLADLATGAPDRLGDPGKVWPRCAQDLTNEQLLRLGDDYLARAGARASAEVTRVVDKQPLNFWQLGLVAIALPGAAVIHCTRDIRDCALSIYTQNFNPAQTWATDLEDIAHYWRGYLRLMAHWHSAAGLNMIDADYAHTVNNLEAQARRLVSLAGLAWDPDVLAFHESRRIVQTPSRWQVREPLYTSSIGRWRHYEKHLEPLLRAVRVDANHSHLG